MYERKNLKPLDGEIMEEGLSIPSEDLVGWAETLRDADFPDDFIRSFLDYHNLDYHSASFKERLNMSSFKPTPEQQKLINEIQEKINNRT